MHGGFAAVPTVKVACMMAPRRCRRSKSRVRLPKQVSLIFFVCSSLSLSLSLCLLFPAVECRLLLDKCAVPLYFVRGRLATKNSDSGLCLCVGTLSGKAITGLALVPVRAPSKYSSGANSRMRNAHNSGRFLTESMYLTQRCVVASRPGCLRLGRSRLDFSRQSLSRLLDCQRLSRQQLCN